MRTDPTSAIRTTNVVTVVVTASPVVEEEVESADKLVSSPAPFNVVVSSSGTSVAVDVMILVVVTVFLAVVLVLEVTPSAGQSADKVTLSAWQSLDSQSSLKKMKRNFESPNRKSINVQGES